MSIDPVDRRRTRRWWMPLVAAATVLVVAAATWALLHPQAGPRASPSTGAPATASRFDRPTTWEQFRPSYHLTPPQHWMNDPQRPVYAGGEWHLYYLYNADYPNGNGTAWYHATSTDLVNWRNRGVAIDKYRNGLGDILTGSAVVDTEGTAGFGRGAIVAVVTQQDDGVQRQSLFFSTDDGYSFTSFDGNPVMDNPGTTDWRDPKIIRSGDAWVMILAEGQRLGFYTSPDLREWTYVSDFATDAYGLLECPDLFEMVDAETGRRTWVLAASAERPGSTTGFAYWTGQWDGQRFAADDPAPQWLDDGPDFYAAVTWDDPTQDAAARETQRYALGWVSNWAYAEELPTRTWHGGALSVTRRIDLDDVDGRLRLRSYPAQQLRALEGTPREAAAQTVDPGVISPISVQPDSPAYRLRVTLDRPESGQFRLRIADIGDTSVTVGFDADAGVAFIDRAHDAGASALPGAYRQVRTGGEIAGDVVSFDVLVDASSVEVFLGDGSSLTALVYPSASTTVTVESTEVPVQLTELSVTPLARLDP